MRYFGGFGLRHDSILFENLLHYCGYALNKYDIVGFSSGALFALQYAMKRIQEKKRVGKLILFSPLLYALDMHHTKIQQTCKIPCATTLLETFPNLTHVDFNTLITHYAEIMPQRLWNPFVEACLISYKKDSKTYLSNLYKQIGFCEMEENSFTFYSNARQNIIANLEDSNTLESFLSLSQAYNIKGAINYNAIGQKSKAFLLFLAEHDNITNSKQLSTYLSQFGICYILKNHNHILQKIE